MESQINISNCLVLNKTDFHSRDNLIKLFFQFIIFSSKFRTTENLHI